MVTMTTLAINSTMIILDSFDKAQYKKMPANIERDLNPEDEHIINSLTPA